MTVSLCGGGLLPTPDMACVIGVLPPSVSWSVLWDQGPDAVPTSVVMGRVHGCGCRCHLAAAVRALPDEHITERSRYLVLFTAPANVLGQSTQHFIRDVDAVTAGLTHQ
jgi:hypothetical protein